MKTLQRLYLREFFLLLVILAVGLSSVFSLIDLTTRIDEFIASGTSIFTIAYYSLLTLPRFFLYLLPMSVLISSLYVFSQANHKKEITAIKGAGGKLRAFLSPFILAGLLLCVAAFFTSEVIVPDFSRQAAEVKYTLKGRTKKLSFSEGVLWLKDKNGFPVKIDLYISEKKLAKGITIFVTGDGSLKEKIVAEQATWNGAAWVLENVVKYEVESGQIRDLKAMAYESLESPDFFSQEVKTTEEMGIAELYHYMQRLKSAGFRNVKMAVDINSKVSFPLINVFMMLLGISLSLRTGAGGALFSSGLGLLISLLYWLSYTFSLSMGYAGIVPPLASAWTIPVLFAALAYWLFTRIPE